MIALLILSATAAEPDAIGGVAIGARFTASEWSRQSDGSFVRRARVAGIEGVVSPTPCHGVVNDVSFQVAYSTAPSSDIGLSVSDTPRAAAELIKSQLAVALTKAGFTASSTEGLWAKTVEGQLRVRSLSVYCGTQYGGLVEVCTTILLAADPKHLVCTEGL